MATKKPKASSKTTKSKSTKPKTAAKTVTKPVSEASKTNTVEKEVITSSKGKSCFSGFFAKKYEEKESILTVFKNHKFYGALLGEVIGSMFITLFLFSLGLMGVASAANYSFLILAVFIAIYSFSGACLNPVITIGMMASRRMSAIRGVLYIVAQVVGAWLGLIIMSGFRGLGENAMDLPAITALEDKTLWKCVFVELMGAVVFGFFFCRAQSYKTAKGAFTYAALVAGGLALAILFAVVVSSNYIGLNNNFVLNPAIAIMEQIFPSVSDSFGDLMGTVAKAALTYIIVPMVGAVIGFYAADAAKRLAGEE